ncbi:hypothetical protein BS78_07G176700 [Paspalum vaginatum]|nr:hypothetical protein BS78_07G176700 [Paspalum vaginatum]
MATATPIDGLPTDVFVEILLRLPAINRWRLRLVCRYWHYVILQRTPPVPEPMALAIVRVWRSRLVPAKALYDDGGRTKHIDGSRPGMVGTCNGLLCLCDDMQPGGAIALLNPATGARLVVPPLPGSAQWVRCWGMGIRDWHEAYSFTCHPETGRYTIVHVPCYSDRSGGFSELQVFTLGEPSWRDVPVPGATCRISAGLVSIDGVTHWVTMDTERVVAFDLGEERVTSMRELPVTGSERGDNYTWRLTEVHGRLGVVSSPSPRWRTLATTPEKIDVWVLEAGRDRRQGWSRRYSVQMGVRQVLAWPHFVHGDYILTKETYSNSVFAHRMPVAKCGEVRSMRITDRGRFVSGMSCYSMLGVFAYVKTDEPLSAYKSKRRASKLLKLRRL